MNYQISIIGIGIIAIYSFLVLLIVAWPLKKLFGTFRWRWVVIAPPVLVLLALPWVEEYWIASHFHAACKDAGVHVVRKVEVEGFYDATMGTGYELIKQYGYRFMEHPAAEDRAKVEHVEMIGDQWKVTILDHPTARYHFKYAYQWPTPHHTEEPIGWKLEKLETVVIDSTNNDVIGRNTKFKRRPNAAEGLILHLLGPAFTFCEGTAPKPPDLRYPLYHYVLIPIKQ